ncbi:hypothetical protein CAC01_30905 (plasmid) [Streptomyces sp. CLI2509]|nr:hypothetical protein CAC01_30905 [Streptomyces sp. CLI2509]
MTTRLVDLLPQAQQHPAGAEDVIQEGRLSAVGQALRPLETPQVSMVDARLRRESAEAETARISQLAKLVAPVVHGRSPRRQFPWFLRHFAPTPVVYVASSLGHISDLELTAAST